MDPAVLSMAISSTKPQQRPPSLQICQPVVAHNQVPHGVVTADCRPGPQELQEKLYQTRSHILEERIQTDRDPFSTNLITSFPVVRDQPIIETTVSEKLSEKPPTTEEDVSVIIK